MSVKVVFSPFLYRFTGGQTTALVEGGTVGECLQELEEQFPGLKAQLLDKDGRLKGYVDIYVNKASAYPEELSRPVKEGDEVNILFLIEGG